MQSKYQEKYNIFETRTSTRISRANRAKPAVELLCRSFVCQMKERGSSDEAQQEQIPSIGTKQPGY